MDNDLLARVAHPNAPRVNARCPPEDASTRAPLLLGERHIAPLTRALHDTRARFAGRQVDEVTQLAFEYDAAEAVREYLVREGIPIPRFSVSWLLGEHTPRMVISGCSMTIAQFAHTLSR